MHKAQQSLRQHHPPPSRPQQHALAKPVPTIIPHPSLPAGDKQTPTGIVHSGRGVPMDVDHIRKTNVCFNCGEPGHFHKECTKPKKPFKVRHMALNLTDEEYQELLVELTPIVSPENDNDFLSDFMDGH